MVLYLWHLSYQFPTLDQLHKKYKYNGKVRIPSEFIPRDRDPKEGFDTYTYYRKPAYDYTVLVVNDAFKDSFGVYAYPQTYVIRGDSIIMHGYIKDMELDNYK